MDHAVVRCLDGRGSNESDHWDVKVPSSTRMTIGRRITSLVYRLLVMLRHPEAALLRFRGVDYGTSSRGRLS